MGWLVPKIWQGGDVWILGGGPSVPKLFGIPKEIIDKVHSGELPESSYSPYMKFLHDKHVIGINVAYRIGDWIDMIFFGDTGFFRQHKQYLANWKGLKVSCAPQKEKIDDWVKIVDRDTKKPRGISSNPCAVSWNKNSGAAAISLAVHTGAKRIFLLGFDMRYDETHEQHWHSVYKRNIVESKKNKSPFHQHLIGFTQIARDAGKLGVQIYNVSPNSAITTLPKITLEEAIELSSNKTLK
ncbi:MAG: hypothetical protein WDA37_04370 [Dysgonamonadaceae bacterium]|jgi:hypothetical protein